MTRRGRPVLRDAGLALGALVMLMPLADLLVGALRSPAERLARPPIYWPSHPLWQNFAEVFREYPLAHWIVNSTIVTLSITIIQLVTTTLAGYALAKFEFRGRAFLMRFVLAAQLFPFFLLVIPLFVILRAWPLAGGNDLLGQGGSGLLKSYAALILPFGVSWYGIFLMRQFIVSIPDSLFDAARLDGAGEWTLLTRIVVPLVRPALITLGVFIFVYQWNEVVWTLTVTRTTPDLQTAPIGIYLIQGAFDNEREKSLQQAATLITILPVVVLFIALQRFYARAMASMTPSA